MDISIIIPVYNVASYIEPCMRSICRQTFKGSYELIIVDDCGTDDSIAIAEKVVAEELPSNASFRILRHAHNRGLSAARNTGDEVSQGKYTLYVDSDDQLTPLCLERLFEKAEETGSDVTYGAYETFSDECPTGIQVFHGSYVMAWNKLIRKDFLVKHHIRFVEGLIHEDNPWSFEVSVHQPKTAEVKDVTYRYLIRENSLQTGKDYQKHFAAYCQILKEYSRIIYSLDTESESGRYVGHLEQQKALFFTMTMEKGTSAQLHELYHLIRSTGPKPPFSKPHLHYFLPELIGFIAYKKFHKYHLC